MKSMTSFARNSFQKEWGAVTFEIRSVNHRYVSFEFRLPEIFHALEADFRRIISKKVIRGKVDCSLKYQLAEDSKLNSSVNEGLVRQLSKHVSDINKLFDFPLDSVNPLDILSWSNVLSFDENNLSLVKEDLIDSFSAVLEQFIKNREKEGETLKNILREKLNLLSWHNKKIREILPRVTKEKKDRILANLQTVKEELDPMRLEQEMIFFIQKIDIEEELDRIESHIKESLNVIEKKEPIGKHLDFLMQELNRETNTILSKSTSNKIKYVSVNIKILIEQMREQIQNIE